MDNNIFETEQNKIREISSEQINDLENNLDKNLENDLDKNIKPTFEKNKEEDEDQHILDDIETIPQNIPQGNIPQNIKPLENKRRFNFNIKYLITGIIIVLVIIIIILVCITFFYPKVDNKLVAELQKTVVDDNIKITDLTSQINTLKDKQKYIITSNKQLQEENDDLKKCLQKYCSVYDNKIQNIETKINKEQIVVQQTKPEIKNNNTKPIIEEVKEEVKNNIPNSNTKVEEVKEDPEVRKIINDLI